MTDCNRGNDGTRRTYAGHEISDDNKRTAALFYNEDERKHRALAGQWETPPMPMYASSAHAQTNQQIMQQQSLPVTNNSNNNTESRKSTASSSLSAISSLPDNSEEYAKALQEAYRKGAEAAARMAQQQQIPSAASCPNFSTGSSQRQQQPSSSTSATANNGLTPAGEIGMTTAVNPFQLNHQIHPAPSQRMNITVPDPLSSAMPPPLPQSASASAIHHQHHPPQTQIIYAPQHLAEQQPFLQPQQSPQQQYPVNTQQQQQSRMLVAPLAQSSSAPSVAPRHPQPIKAASTQLKSQPQQQPGRSLSMPDMSTYAAEAEEDKRLKRLARNRASARLRRLRKKNLVDAYETEVGILERTLKQLEAHEWGKDTDDHMPLLDALGMERGQQAITSEERNTIIRDILKQQMKQVNMLQQTQREQEVLAMLVSEAGGENKYDNSEEDMQMFYELQDILQLSDDQKAKLRESSKGLDKEVEALETVSASLEAMQKNDWLLNEGVQKITDQFTSILHKNQQSKLLLWTDANTEAVDQLNLVQVQPLQSAPMFSFGVESTTPTDDD